MHKKILLIEEEPALVLTLTMRLEANKSVVITSKDGIDGLHKALLHAPDLVILDLTIPGSFNFVRELKARKDDFRLIPIIALTSRNSMRDLFNPGEITAFFSKPVSTLEFLEEIKKVLKISEEERGTAEKALLVGIDWEAMRPIKAVLEEKGFIVYVANSAYQAIQETVKIVPSLVLAPSVIAGMDIWEFGNFMMQLPVMKNVPLIVYDLGNMGQMGTKNIKATKVIVYESHEDLCSQIKKFLKEDF